MKVSQSLIVAVVGVALSGLIGYFTAQTAAEGRLSAIETREEERYTALIARIEMLAQHTREGHDEIRMDLTGIRAEILGILKEQSR